MRGNVVVGCVVVVCRYRVQKECNKGKGRNIRETSMVGCDEVGDHDKAKDRPPAAGTCRIGVDQLDTDIIIKEIWRKIIVANERVALVDEEAE